MGRGGDDGRAGAAGLGLHHRGGPHGAQGGHPRRGLLGVGHGVGRGAVHVALGAGHGVVLQGAHVVAVHGLHLARVVRVEPRVLVAELLLHHAVAAVGPAVHVRRVAVHALVHTSTQPGANADPTAHAVTSRSQQPTW